MGYEKPMIIESDGMSEGVFMASGSQAGCYSVGAAIVQTPTTGFDYYVIQINAVHSADHTKDAQTLTISFNQPVVYGWGGGSYKDGNGTNTLVISLWYHQNPSDNIGFGDLTVQTVNKDQELQITNVNITD